MTTVFVYKNCSTCRKALKWLNENEVAFTERDLVTKPPTKKELKDILTLIEKRGGSMKDLFNTSGQVYRELGLSQKIKAGLSEKESFELLSANGMLVKRPLVWTDRDVVLGFKEDAFTKIVSSNMRTTR